MKIQNKKSLISNQTIQLTESEIQQFDTLLQIILGRGDNNFPILQRATS